jgi:predicted acylesterase/phospholipase RssA/CRP-like cAMP-binding protein
MADVSQLARSPLFAGLDASALELIARRARPRAFAPGEPLCHLGEPSERCWLITAGLVDVIGPAGGAPAGEVIARQRKGATVGEVAVILGEPHAETVIASIPTTTLELPAADLGELVRQFPQILVNVVRNAQGRLAQAHARSSERELGETVALATGASLRRTVPSLLAAVNAATPRHVTALDRQFSFAGAVTAADDLVSSHATVLLPVELDTETVTTLMREADRVVALAGTASEVAQLGAVQRARGAHPDVEVVLVGREAAQTSGAWPQDAPLRAIRSCELGPGLSLLPNDLAWLARHLTRTKIGLALGAGGAKGYAHVGALQVLEEAGYVVDCVAGSSIGAIVASYIALGADAAQINATLRSAFDPPTVAEIFKTSLSGRASGLDVMTRMLRETTGDKTFADTAIPLTIMAVDLDERAPAPLREGTLWEALLGATALAGFRRPYERDGHRFVDGLALVPVPTGAVVQDGADLTVAVNLIARETLQRWPGGPPPEPPPERRRRGVLDDLLEVMDLSQLSESVRHSELADVTIAPRFGPGEWRDFHLADLFLAAGRVAAQEQLPALRALASPASTPNRINQEGGGSERADAVRL